MYEYIRTEENEHQITSNALAVEGSCTRLLRSIFMSTKREGYGYARNALVSSLPTPSMQISQAYLTALCLSPYLHIIHQKVPPTCPSTPEMAAQTRSLPFLPQPQLLPALPLQLRLPRLHSAQGANDSDSTLHSSPAPGF